VPEATRIGFGNLKRPKLTLRSIWGAFEGNRKSAELEVQAGRVMLKFSGNARPNAIPAELRKLKPKKPLAR
jgi:hypothetical protein